MRQVLRSRYQVSWVRQIGTEYANSLASLEGENGAKGIGIQELLISEHL